MEGVEWEKGLTMVGKMIRLVVMNYKCPLCQSKLVGMDGEKMHPDDKNYGYSLYCLNVDCPAQECFGHGKNEKEAYEVVIAKYGTKQK